MSTEVWRCISASLSSPYTSCSADSVSISPTSPKKLFIQRLIGLCNKQPWPMSAVQGDDSGAAAGILHIGHLRKGCRSPSLCIQTASQTVSGRKAVTGGTEWTATTFVKGWPRRSGVIIDQRPELGLLVLLLELLCVLHNRVKWMGS